MLVQDLRNRSPEAINYPQLVTVTVQMCPGFVRFALRGVLPVPEKGETDKDGVQVNGYGSATEYETQARAFIKEQPAAGGRTANQVSSRSIFVA